MYTYGFLTLEALQSVLQGCSAETLRKIIASNREKFFAPWTSDARRKELIDRDLTAQIHGYFCQHDVVWPPWRVLNSPFMFLEDDEVQRYGTDELLRKFSSISVSHCAAKVRKQLLRRGVGGGAECDVMKVLFVSDSWVFYPGNLTTASEMRKFYEHVSELFCFEPLWLMFLGQEHMQLTPEAVQASLDFLSEKGACAVRAWLHVRRAILSVASGTDPQARTFSEFRNRVCAAEEGASVIVRFIAELRSDTELDTQTKDFILWRIGFHQKFPDVDNVNKRLPPRVQFAQGICFELYEECKKWVFDTTLPLPDTEEKCVDWLRGFLNDSLELNVYRLCGTFYVPF